MKFDVARAAVVAGDGVVMRRAGLLCVARCPDPAVLAELLDLCGQVAGHDPGRALARRLVAWLSGPGAPGDDLVFGTIAAAGERVAVFLSGAIGVAVPDRRVSLSGADAAAWTDRLLDRPDSPLVLALDGTAGRPDPAAGLHDLIAGVVPGAGVVLVPASGSGPAGPRARDLRAAGGRVVDIGGLTPWSGVAELEADRYDGSRVDWFGTPHPQAVEPQRAVEPSAPIRQDPAPSERNGREPVPEPERVAVPTPSTTSPPPTARNGRVLAPAPPAPAGAAPAAAVPLVPPGVDGAGHERVAGNDGSGWPWSGPLALVAPDEIPDPDQPDPDQPDPAGWLPAAGRRPIPPDDLGRHSGRAGESGPGDPDGLGDPDGPGDPDGLGDPDGSGGSDRSGGPLRFSGPDPSDGPHPSGVSGVPPPHRTIPNSQTGPAELPSAGDPQPDHGRLCARGHRTDPLLTTCTECEIELDAGSRRSLGTLVFDDGAVYTVDGEYVVGRMPEADPRIRSGLLRSIVVEDPTGAVSRVHAEVRVYGADVVLVDSGSRNGTFVAESGDYDWTALPTGRSQRLLPGTRVRIGKRTFVFEAPPA